METPVLSANESMKGKSRQRILKDNIDGWLFVLPAFLFLFLFMIYPIIHTLLLCFFKYNFVFDPGPVFNGFGNFVKIFQTEAFIRAIFNTLYFALVYVVTIFIFGFLIGLIFSRSDLFASKLSKVVLFIPLVVPVSMSSFMFLFMLNPQHGLINSLLKDYLGMPSLAREWMNDPATALNVILLVTVWQRIGFIGLLFFSGITAIPDSVIEASIIDGAGIGRRVLSIILPNLRETYLIVGILAIITSIKLFAQVVAMTGASSIGAAGGPANSTLTMYVLTWRRAFIDFDLGIGSAMGYFMSLVIVVMFGINFIITRARKA